MWPYGSAPKPIPWAPCAGVTIRSADRRTQRRRLARSAEHRSDRTRIAPTHVTEGVGIQNLRSRLGHHGRMTTAVVSERRARVLAAAAIVVGFVVMREISMDDEMHGGLGNLGHSRGDREQQRHRDQKSHALLPYCGVQDMSRQPLARMSSIRCRRGHAALGRDACRARPNVADGNTTGSRSMAARRDGCRARPNGRRLRQLR